MGRCVAIRHVAFEDLGCFRPSLDALGFESTYIEAATGDLAGLDALAPDLMVVLGGPIGAYQDDCYPFLADELRLIEARLAADRPMIGICLGAQLMARALGARVYPNQNGKEIGWSPLTLTEAGHASALAELGDAPVLHWHGDTFELPDGALRLASSAITPNQAFSWQRRALGLQFHVEATGHGLESWFVGHACEIGGVAGLSVGDLRDQTRSCAPTMERRGAQMLRRFLSDMILN